jgi:hypothetical protein
MVCRAQLASRSPPRESRCRVVLPEEAGTGAVPDRAAKDASLRSRSGVSTGGDQQLRCSDWTHAVQGHQVRVGVTGQVADLTPQVVGFGGQELVTLGQRLQRGQDCPGGVLLGVGSASCQGVEQRFVFQVPILLTHRHGGGDEQMVDLVHCRGAGLYRRPAGVVERPQCLDVLVPGRCGRVSRQHRAGGLVGVNRVGLATHAAHRPLRPDHLANLKPGLAGRPGNPSPVGAGALDPQTDHGAEASHKRQRVGIPNRGRRELAITQFAANTVHNPDVDGLGVRAHTANDAADDAGCPKRARCHDGPAFRVDAVGRRRSGGRQDIDEARPGSY